MDYAIVPMGLEHVQGAVALQRSCFPAPFPEELLWSQDHLLRHLEIFPEGQFVALADGVVVASCTNCIVSEELWRSHLSWAETIGGPFLENHSLSGSTLYGVDVSVHPVARGKGIMRALYGKRFELVEDLKLARYGTAVRIPDYAAYAQGHPEASVEQYAEEVAAGRASDRTLTPMLRVGLKLEGVIRDYMEDSESANAAAVLQWP